MGSPERMQAEPQPPLGAAVGRGLALGLIFVAPIVLERWWTREPATAALLGFDLAFGLGAGALLGLASRLLPPRLARAFLGLAGLFGYAFTLHQALWRQDLHRLGEPALLQLVHLGAVLVLGASLWFGWRRDNPRSSLAGTTAWTGALFLVALEGTRHSGWISLAFPLGAALLALQGLPAAPVRALPAALALLVSLATTLGPPPWAQGTFSIAPSPEPWKRGPGVILIVADTLRRDRMSWYGNERGLTPELDRWAAGGLVFDDMSAASSWTLPSHASMFTGLYPRTHGAHGLPTSKRLEAVRPLAPPFRTLAESARADGIATGAVVSNAIYLGSRYGLGQGFDTYWVGRTQEGLRFAPADWLAWHFAREALSDYEWSYYRAERVTDHALAWLRAHEEGSFFLFLNYMEVHNPSYRRPTPEVPLVEPETSYKEHRYLVGEDLLRGKPIDEAVWRDLENNYDRELQALDRELGRLFRYLEESGLEGRTHVVFTSDHGEYFGEHGLIFHSAHLHREVVSVPLAIRGPGIEPGRSTRPVQGVDLFPTLLELLEVEPQGEVQGLSVFAEEERPVIAEWYSANNPWFRSRAFGERFRRDLLALRSGSWRAFFDGEGALLELYDLANDPTESENLVESGALPPEAVLADLRRAREAWLLDTPQAPTWDPKLEAYDPRELELLQQLGYASEE